MSIKPSNKIYDNYSEFLTNKENAAKQNVKDARESLTMHWDIPKDSKLTSSLDVPNIPNKFNRTQCQAGYFNYLQGKELPIDATTIKMQNGLLEAAEQAYRIRHLSIPRALAMGAMFQKRWATGFIKLALLKNIKSIGDIASEDYTSKFG